MPFRCNHHKPVTGIKLCFQGGQFCPLRSVAPQLLIPKRKRGLAEVQRPAIDVVQRGEDAVEKPAYFGALGVFAMTANDDADLHGRAAQAASESLNNASVRSLAWLAAVASKESR